MLGRGQSGSVRTWGEPGENFDSRAMRPPHKCTGKHGEEAGGLPEKPGPSQEKPPEAKNVCLCGYSTLPAFSPLL